MLKEMAIACDSSTQRCTKLRLWQSGGTPEPRHISALGVLRSSNQWELPKSWCGVYERASILISASISKEKLFKKEKNMSLSVINCCSFFTVDDWSNLLSIVPHRWRPQIRPWYKSAKQDMAMVLRPTQDFNFFTGRDIEYQCISYVI